MFTTMVNAVIQISPRHNYFIQPCKCKQVSTAFWPVTAAVIKPVSRGLGKTQSLKWYYAYHFSKIFWNMRLVGCCRPVMILFQQRTAHNNNSARCWRNVYDAWKVNECAASFLAGPFLKPLVNRSNLCKKSQNIWNCWLKRLTGMTSSTNSNIFQLSTPHYQSFWRGKRMKMKNDRQNRSKLQVMHRYA